MESQYLVSGQLKKKKQLNSVTFKLEPVIWSRDTGQWMPCFGRCQLTITWMSNIKVVPAKKRGLHLIVSHWHTWMGGRTGGRTTKTNFSRRDGLPYYLTHGAPRARLLRAELRFKSDNFLNSPAKCDDHSVLSFV